MLELKSYQEADKREMSEAVADFFGYHAALVGTTQAEDNSGEIEATLKSWCEGDNAFYVVWHAGERIGFLRLCYRGDIVAWIEDIYIKPAWRRKGFGTEIIAHAENIVKNKPGYEAVCLDVVPRNEAALALYHKLGYIDLSLITLRKEFGESKRDKPVSLFGKDFHY